LDLQADLERVGRGQDAALAELRGLIQEALSHLGRAGMASGEVHPRHSFSIRSEDERRAVHPLLAPHRQLPAEQRQAAPGLLNGLGKLQLGTGDLVGARETFDEVALAVAEPPARAEARFNAYRVCLAARRYDDALASIRDAARDDPARFAPFPLQ